eukprot:364276-Chlamydomonas_euryale.AAC.2
MGLLAAAATHVTAVAPTAMAIDLLQLACAWHLRAGRVGKPLRLGTESWHCCVSMRVGGTHRVATKVAHVSSCC